MTAEEYIRLCENSYFTGSFSESVIKRDLEDKKTIDRMSRLGSRQTNCLAEKKQFYKNDFDKTEQMLNTILRDSTSNNQLMQRCRMCKDQINNLRNIVEKFN